MSLFYFVKVRRKKINKKLERLNLAKYKERARAMVLEKIIYWNQFYNFSYNRVFTKAQATRWGSCSSRGNLNFNYKIFLLPPRLADYIIVHELCHLGEFNHSRSFWNLVAQTIPNYMELRNELKSINMRLLI